MENNEILNDLNDLNDLEITVVEQGEETTIGIEHIGGDCNW